MKIRTELPGTLLKPLAAHAAKDAMRYAIAGILVECEEGRVTLAATDGHRLAVVEYADPISKETGSCIVPLEAIRKVKVAGSVSIVLEVEDEKGRITSFHKKGTESIVEFSPLEGRFPPYEDVIPSYNGEAPAEFIKLKPKYMADACTLVDKFRESFVEEMKPGARFEYRDNKKPITISIEGSENGEKCTVVIMPVNPE